MKTDRRLARGFDSSKNREFLGIAKNQQLAY